VKSATRGRCPAGLLRDRVESWKPTLCGTGVTGDGGSLVRRGSGPGCCALRLSPGILLHVTGELVVWHRTQIQPLNTPCLCRKRMGTHISVVDRMRRRTGAGDVVARRVCLGSCTKGDSIEVGVIACSVLIAAPVLFVLRRWVSPLFTGRWRTPGWFVGTAGFCVVTAAVTWFIGAFAGPSTNPEESCRAAGVTYDGAYRSVHWREPSRVFPLRNKCNATYDLVPAWVNPALVLLLVLTTTCLVVAVRLVVADRRTVGVGQLRDRDAGRRPLLGRGRGR